MGGRWLVVIVGSFVGVLPYVRHHFYRPFEADPFFNRHLGLKPQAKS
jgi:hypothetical protein